MTVHVPGRASALACFADDQMYSTNAVVFAVLAAPQTTEWSSEDGTFISSYNLFDHIPQQTWAMLSSFRQYFHAEDLGLV